MQQTTCALLCALALGLVISPLTHASEKSDAERAVNQFYQEIQSGYAEKNVAKIYGHCDPGYEFVGVKGDKSNLAQNRDAMQSSFGNLRSIKATITPETSERLGDKFYVRYKQTNEMQFPLKNSPSTIWFVAEDTWQYKNGQWRLLSTHVVNDSITHAKERLEVQKKQMEFEDEQRRSQRCLNGLGYGCGAPR